jgi:hypothetical protein
LEKGFEIPAGLILVILAIASSPVSVHAERRLVSRFRSSQHYAARRLRTSESNDTSNLLI